MKNIKKLSILGLVALGLTGCFEKPNIKANLSDGGIEAGKFICEGIIGGTETVWLVPVNFTTLDRSTFSSLDHGFNFYCGDFYANGKSATGIVWTFTKSPTTDAYDVTDYGGYTNGNSADDYNIRVIFFFTFEVKRDDDFTLGDRDVTFFPGEVYVAPTYSN